jgi:hypothetical protein
MEAGNLSVISPFHESGSPTPMLVYREHGRVLYFNLTGNHKPCRLIIHAYACSDAQFQPIQLTPEDQRQIVARLAEFFESTDTQVEMLLEHPPKPLHSLNEAPQHRFPKSGKR